MHLLIWPAAIIIGIILGMFGAGGGMATVPMLIYLADMPVKEAIAMSLWIVAIVSFTSLLQQRAWAQLQWKLIITFGITGVIGSITGSYISHLLTDQAQTFLFAGLVIGVTLWLSRIELSNRVKVFKFIPASITGFVIGIVTGILGVGGGFLLVPALIFIGIGNFKTAVAHSLVLITLNSTAGGISHLQTATFSLTLALTISIMAVIGSVLGNIFLNRLSGEKLQKYFSALLIFIGAIMFWRAITY